ncbi:rRNA maturation RNase YbeY [Candidatus Gracilibacteria bacterium]|nr:MAG: rRNA maturation RNase YbeY [Candidatus Gracilibacteria bacterium]
MFGFHLLHIPKNLKIDPKKIEKILDYIEKTVPEKGNGILNIAFLHDDEIQHLNKAYRKIDAPTDVLSFHYFDDFSTIKDDETAGECIFSWGKIQSQAKKFSHSEAEEFYILFIHSVLHILGYDHENDREFRAMWKYEKLIREKFGFSVER